MLAMMRWLTFPIAVLAAAAVFLYGQTAPPNAAGVSGGHVHLYATDPAKMQQLLVDVLGGTKAQLGSLNLVKFPGMLIAVGQRAEPGGGSDGTAIGHIGFYVKSFADVKAKAAAAGLGFRELTPNIQAFVTFPGDIVVEVQEDASVGNNPVVFNHFHLNAGDNEATRQWYLKEFGGVDTERRKNNKGAGVPGVIVDFLPRGKNAAAPVTPSKGRAMDHIGFEVKDLKAFADKLQADGVKFDMQPTDMSSKGLPGLKIAFITDPNGAYIELTEGLNKVQ
jgi:catechol 2,3-dioxygenase-like lactoylglutathione lyase family enzyme